MQNRRNFLKQASLMLAGGLVAPQLLSSCGGKSGQAAATHPVPEGPYDRKDPATRVPGRYGWYGSHSHPSPS